MSLHRMLLARAAEAKPLRIGVIGAGKFGSMYLSQIPTTPGIHLLGIADLSPPRARENLARLGWKPEVTAADVVRRGAQARQHLPHRGLARAGQPSRDRHHRRIDGRSDRRRRACAGSFQARQERGDGDGRGRRLLRPAAGQARGPGRRDLQPRLWRPAGADLRAGRLGAHLGLRGDGGRPRPQVAAALRAVDARDRVEVLGPERRAGQARRAEPQDVQFLPRRLQARHREHGRRPTPPASRRRRTASPSRPARSRICRS